MKKKNNIYYSSFIPGLANLVAQVLKEKFKNLKILCLFDGGVLYETSSEIENIKNIKFFNNSFWVIHYFKTLPGQTFKGAILNFLEKKIAFSSSIHFKSREFKILYSNENQFVSVDKEIRDKFEKLISVKYHLHAIPISNKKPCNEFWVLKRSEHYCFLMLKITDNVEKAEKGELSLPLSSVLCYLSEPSKEDKFLDPFAGHGSIAFSRILYPFKKMSILDVDKNNVDIIKTKMDKKKLQNRGNIFIGHQNFFAADLHDNSYNKIVTDPPWGSYTRIEDIDSFYTNMFNIFTRVLELNGILILLVDRAISPIIVKLLDHYEGSLSLKDKLDILYSGRKVSIYKISKI